jgi:putative transposase
MEPRPKSKPGWVSVYRWLRALRGSDDQAVALIDASSNKGNRQARYPDAVLGICEEVIAQSYLTLERPSVTHVVNLAKASVRQANKLRPQSDQLPLPSRRLFERLISDIPAYDTHVARYGKEAARKKFRSSLRHRVTGAPLQRAEMDHTRMDVFVVDDEHGLPMGRPWLTILIDDNTRMVLGMSISFEPPSRATVAKCLKHAFVPKTGLRAKYPDIVNDWDAFGIPSELVLDGGTEFHSEELERICFELGIEQHFSPRKTPWFKGKVERFQGTLNRGVAVTTPGKTFEGIVDRDDYDPKKHAVIRLSALLHLTTRWIVDVYHQKAHAALGCSPAQSWKSNIRPHDIPLMADPLRFDAIVGGSESRRLTHKGIEYAGLVYNSPEMRDLRQHLGDNLNVEIRIDRSNLGSVIVIHPERDTPYRVPCLSEDYAEGLTEWQHKVCKRYAREKLQAEGNADDWLDSLLEIEEIVQAEMKLGKRKGVARERISRWHTGRKEAGTLAIADEPAKVPLAAVTLSPTSTMAKTAAPVLALPVERKRFVARIEERNESTGALVATGAETGND